MNIKWRPYQIPLLYGNLNGKTREAGFSQAFLHKSIYDPEAVIKRFDQESFSAKNYLKGLNMEFLFVRPNRYNLNGSDGTRNAGMMVDEDSQKGNTYKLKIAAPFPKDYEYVFVNQDQSIYQEVTRQNE